MPVEKGQLFLSLGMLIGMGLPLQGFADSRCEGIFNYKQGHELVSEATLDELSRMGADILKIERTAARTQLEKEWQRLFNLLSSADQIKVIQRINEQNLPRTNPEPVDEKEIVTSSQREALGRNPTKLITRYSHPIASMQGLRPRHEPRNGILKIPRMTVNMNGALVQWGSLGRFSMVRGEWNKSRTSVFDVTTGQEKKFAAGLLTFEGNHFVEITPDGKFITVHDLLNGTERRWQGLPFEDHRFVRDHFVLAKYENSFTGEEKALIHLIPFKRTIEADFPLLFSQDLNRVAFYEKDGKLRVIDLHSGQPVPLPATLPKTGSILMEWTATRISVRQSTSDVETEQGRGILDLDTMSFAPAPAEVGPASRDSKWRFEPGTHFYQHGNVGDPFRLVNAVTGETFDFANVDRSIGILWNGQVAKLFWASRGLNLQVISLEDHVPVRMVGLGGFRGTYHYSESAVLVDGVAGIHVVDLRGAIPNVSKLNYEIGEERDFARIDEELGLATVVDGKDKAVYEIDVATGLVLPANSEMIAVSPDRKYQWVDTAGKLELRTYNP